MSWIQKLCEVYDAMAGVEGCTLIPVGFTQKKIKYNIILSAEGEFVTTHELPEDEQTCIVPSTSQAEGRVGATGAPFPLADGLKYIVPGVGEENPRFEMYLDQLAAWSCFEGAPKCLQILCQYLQKRTLFQDLMQVPGLKLKYEKDGSGADAKSFACFSVQTLDGDSRLWMREDVQESWMKYAASLEDGNPGLCYAAGKRLAISEKHPKYSGNAKLISAEDAGYPFLYKGRFVEDRSAVTVSSAVSARAHNALKWLVEHQGFSRYGIQIVGWNVAMPVLNLSPVEEIAEDEDDEDITGDKRQKARQPDTFEFYATALRDAVEGYYTQLDRLSRDEKLTEEDRKRRDEIVILGLQAATPGRMSIIYYQEMPGNKYVEHLQNWEKQCRWEIPGKEKEIRPPHWIEICEAIMGHDAVVTAKGDFRCEKAATKQMREIQMRLLSCVTNGSKLPEDMVKGAFARAIVPSSFTNKDGSWNRYNWSRSVSVTCALIRKLHLDKEGKELSYVLDVHEQNRDYLFGRLLAVAHKLELDTMQDVDPKRRNKTKTAAVQAMTAYVQNPAKSWTHLYCRLLPKLRELGKDGYSARRYQNLFGEIESQFLPEEREKQSGLFYLFLAGFSAQLRELYCKAEERQDTPAPISYAVPTSRDELFGCLLAVADDCQWNAEAEEKNKHRVSNQDGATNAMRLTTAFVSRPCTIWGQVHDKLIPYLEKMDVKDAVRVQKRLRRIEQAFTNEERLSDAPLGDGFLHGYLSMRRALMVKEGLDTESWQSDESIFSEIEDRDAAFGALLALENLVERWALDLDSDPEHNRSSNAMRFLQRASQRPDEVLPYLMERMRPYEGKLGFPHRIKEERKRLEKRIEEKGWNTAEPLHPGYLHTFYTYELTTNKRKEN